jgi:hypothetical protein
MLGRLFHLPYNSKDPLLTREFEELVCYSEEKSLYLVIGCDSSSHHILWSCTNCKDRGEALLEFPNSMKFEILNQGNDPTFCSARRPEMTDISLGSFGLLESF